MLEAGLGQSVFQRKWKRRRAEKEWGERETYAGYIIVAPWQIKQKERKEKDWKAALSRQRIEKRMGDKLLHVHPYVADFDGWDATGL